MEVANENMFRRTLVGEPPADVKSIRVTLKPGAQAVRSKPRVYAPQRAKLLVNYMVRLEAAGVTYCSNQAMCESVAIAIPTGANSQR